MPMFPEDRRAEGFGHMASCIKHPQEVGVGHCGRCGGSWCAECLVRAYGDRKPPLCMACAMYAAGVRAQPERPALSRRELKALAKQANAASRAAAVAAPPPPPPPAPVAPVDELTGSWSDPWWDTSQAPTLAD